MLGKGAGCWGTVSSHLHSSSWNPLPPAQPCGETETQSHLVTDSNLLLGLVSVHNPWEQPESREGAVILQCSQGLNVAQGLSLPPKPEFPC